MSLRAELKYKIMKDYGAPALMAFQDLKKRKPRPIPEAFGPPLESNKRLKEILSRHYFLARYVPGVKKVAWVTSGAPVELLRAFDFYAINTDITVGAIEFTAENKTFNELSFTTTTGYQEIELIDVNLSSWKHL